MSTYNPSSTFPAPRAPRFRPDRTLPLLVFVLVNLLVLWRVDRFEPPATAMGAEEAEAVAVAPVSPVERGRVAFAELGCNACHDVAAERILGPGLGGMYGETRRFEDGTTGVVDDAYVRESILMPQARVREGYPASMPAYGDLIDDRLADDLTAYIRSLP